MEVEVVSYVCELLLAALWPICMIPFGFEIGTGVQYAIGAFAWAILSIGVVMCADADRFPLFTGGAVFSEWLDNKTTSGPAILRLLTMFVGNFLGWLCLNSIVSRAVVEDQLYIVFGKLSLAEPLVMFGVQIALLSLIAAARRTCDNTENKLQKAVKTWTWAALAMFPWGGASFTFASFLWVPKAYDIASLAMGVYLGISVIISGAVAYALHELYVTDQNQQRHSKQKRIHREPPKFD